VPPRMCVFFAGGEIITETNENRIKNSKPQRKSVKLKDYDYSTPGMYYFTLCSYEKEHLFGWIANSKMYLNQAGCMLEKWLHKIEEKFTGIQSIHPQIMPNHIHGIIQISDKTKEIENGLSGSPCAGSPTFFDVIGWFKTMTTNDYIKGVKTEGWQRFQKQLWQRSVYEHIIRDEKEYEHAVLYINRNPERWSEDKYNPSRGRGPSG